MNILWFFYDFDDFHCFSVKNYKQAMIFLIFLYGWLNTIEKSLKIIKIKKNNKIIKKIINKS